MIAIWTADAKQNRRQVSAVKPLRFEQGRLAVGKHDRSQQRKWWQLRIRGYPTWQRQSRATSIVRGHAQKG